MVVMSPVSPVIVSCFAVVAWGQATRLPHDVYQDAISAFDKGDYPAAIESYSLLREMMPGSKEVIYNLGMAHEFHGDMARCIETYESGIALFPDDGRMYLHMCRSIAEKLNQGIDVDLTDDQIISTCRQAVHLLPEDDPEPLDVLGSVLLLMRYKEGIPTMERWVARFGGSSPPVRVASVKANIASALLWHGDYRRAWNVAVEAMRLDDNPGTVSAAANIRSIGWPMDPVAWALKSRYVHEFVGNLSIYDPRVCLSGSWRLALNWSEEADAGQGDVHVDLLNRDNAMQTYGQPNDPEFVGKPIPKYPHAFHERFIYRIYLREAFMAGSGIVHGDCAVYSGGHHVNVDLHTLPTSDEGVRIIEIDCPVASIIQHQMVNYYHFILEAFPKMLLLVEHVMSDPGNADCKLLLPPEGWAGFIDDVLAMTEFDSVRDRILRYPLPPTLSRYHFRAGLHLVDWIHPAEDVHKTLAKNAWGVFWPPRAAILRVQAFFHDALRRRGRFPDTTGTDDEIVYVSRRFKKNVRAFPNENDFIGFLRERFGQRLRIHVGNETLLDQVAMFAKAKIVVGAHGAGLTNFAFTQPGAVLIMFPGRPHIDFCFGHLVAALGRRHIVMSTIPGSFYYGNFPAITRPSMVLVAETIENALSQRASTEGDIPEEPSAHDDL
ncbi:Glycosyltransferase 61 catalytic domain-containing protein [Plasmodiophora brassicae]|nr:hypothetical protein PBRA_002787 [Plasmodiophora brassicae]